MWKQKFGFWSDYAFYRRSRLILVMLFDWIGKLESHESQNVPHDGGILLAANHVSFIDPLVIGSACHRELNFVARHNTLEIPIFGWFLRKVNTHPIRRGTADLKALRHTISMLKSGKAVLIFPEGTRSFDGQIGEATGGIGFLVHNAKVPIIPIFISGSEKILPRSAKWITPSKMRVFFGEPIDFSEIIEATENRREIYDRIAKKIMTEIAALRDKNLLDEVDPMC